MCPRDVEDLINSDDDEEEDVIDIGAGAGAASSMNVRLLSSRRYSLACAQEIHSIAQSRCSSMEDWTQPRYLVDPTSLTHLDCEGD